MSVTQELPWARAVDRAAPLSPAPPSRQGRGRGRGRVVASHFTAHREGAGGCRALSYLPDEVDVKPRRVVEFVALQEKGEGVEAGCAGVTEVVPVHGGELLLHLQRWKSRGGTASTEQRAVHPRCGEEPHRAAASEDPGVPGLGEQGGPGRLQAALPSLSLSRDLCAPPSSLQLPSAQQRMGCG